MFVSRFGWVFDHPFSSHSFYIVVWYSLDARYECTVHNYSIYMLLFAGEKKNNPFSISFARFKLPIAWWFILYVVTLFFYRYYYYVLVVYEFLSVQGFKLCPRECCILCPRDRERKRERKKTDFMAQVCLYIFWS